MGLIKPISISLSPNTEPDDVWLAFKLFFQPWKWKRGKAVKELEDKFKEYFGVKYAFAFNSGRSSLMAILKSLEMEKGSEVLLQAFTCNAVANPIIWSGLRPVYADCNKDDFNINQEDFERKISSKSQAVIIQHTFGIPANIDPNGLILIEDMAHALGIKKNISGKAAFFSFSRDKVISSVYGGMAVTNDPLLAKKIREFQDNLKNPSHCWISQQLVHPVLMNVLILPTYRILGKYILVLFQWLRILSKAVHWKEKQAQKPGYFPKKMPNALAILALNQFTKLERFNKHRKEIANFYFEKLKNTSFELPPKEGIFLRFSVKHAKAHKIIKNCWRKNMLIGDWYTSPIAPDDTNLEKMGYKPGSCPKAEELAKITLNLPTHINISKKQCQKIIDFISSY